MAQTEKETVATLLQACEDRLSSRLTGIESRLANIEARLGNLDGTANSISTKVNTIATMLLAPPEVRSLGSVFARSESADGNGCQPKALAALWLRTNGAEPRSDAETPDRRCLRLFSHAIEARPSSPYGSVCRIRGLPTWLR